MNIVVTGCNGFIGYHTCRRLLDIGYIVVGIDIDYESPMAMYRNHRLISNDNFIYFNGDIRAIPNLRVNDIYAVIHLAGAAGVRDSISNPTHYIMTNIYGSQHILDLCVKYNVPRVIIASSSSVYGDTDSISLESDNTDMPLSPYAATKKSVEVLSYSYHHLYNMDITNLRFFTVYGPAGRFDMAIPGFIRNIAEGIPITVYGDGTQTRAFTYVDDIVDGIIKVLDLDIVTNYNIFNLGNNVSTILNEVIDLVSGYLGIDPIISYEDRNISDVLYTVADVHKAKRVLGWEPTIDIETGIRKTIDWYLENREWTKDI